MNLRILFSPEFRRHYKKILKKFNYLSPNIKNDFNDGFIKKLEYLQLFPYMYPKSMHNPIYRKIPIKKYIILYRVSKNQIIFEDIIHEKSKKFNNQD